MYSIQVYCDMNDALGDEWERLSQKDGVIFEEDTPDQFLRNMMFLECGCV